MGAQQFARNRDKGNRQQVFIERLAVSMMFAYLRMQQKTSLKGYVETILRPSPLF